MNPKPVIKIFQNQATLLFAVAPKLFNEKYLLHAELSEADSPFLTTFYSASLLIQTVLKRVVNEFTFNENNHLTLVFYSPEILKLKQIKKLWKLPTLPILSELTLQINKITTPFFTIDQPITKIIFNLAELMQTIKGEIINLSTFTKNTKLWHKLVFKLPERINKLLAVDDHRQLNKQLKFFYFTDKLGSGLPFWLERGVIVKNLISDYLHKLEKSAGFRFVETPILGSEMMYLKSGHLQHYREYMFPPLKRNNEVLFLRPMTCPHHCLIFASEIRSYHDLPMRISENALLFRQEASGALIGLERVRQMMLKDTHTFLPMNDLTIIKNEIIQYFHLTKTVLKALGISIREIYLSINDEQQTEKFIALPELWKQTTQILRDILKELKIDFQIMVGEAAFYGPKIDFQIDTKLGHNITISTIQLDFSLPKKFNLRYRTANQTGQEFKTPILIHHGLIGTYERLLTILMESNQGWLPFWLSPVQIMLIPVVNDIKIQQYGEKILQLLQKHNLRAEIASPHKTLVENIKMSWNQKIPVRVFVGINECESNQITYRFHNKSKKQTTDVFAFIDRCLQLLKIKK